MSISQGIEAYLNTVVEKANKDSEIYLALTCADRETEDYITDDQMNALIMRTPGISGYYRVSSLKYSGVDEMFNEVIEKSIKKRVELELLGITPLWIKKIEGLHGHHGYDMSDAKQQKALAHHIGQTFINTLPETLESLDLLVYLYDAIGIGKGNERGDSLVLSFFRQRNNPWSGVGYRETNDSALVAAYCKQKAWSILLATGKRVSPRNAKRYEQLLCTKSDRFDLLTGDSKNWTDLYNNNVDVDRAVAEYAAVAVPGR